MKKRVIYAKQTHGIGFVACVSQKTAFAQNISDISKSIEFPVSMPITLLHYYLTDHQHELTICPNACDLRLFGQTNRKKMVLFVLTFIALINGFGVCVRLPRIQFLFCFNTMNHMFVAFFPY